MFGIGSSTFIRLVIKEDGGPNWFGITILAVSLLVLFWWRCCAWIPENWVAIRRRFNRIARHENGLPVEYDPLQDHPTKPGKKVRNFRFRLYMVHSLVMVNCGTRETNLDIDAVTLGDVDFDTSFSVDWNVSRAPGDPTRSFLKPAEPKWRWRSEKDELEQLVRKYAADAVVTAYEEISSSLEDTPARLPLLDFATSQHLLEAKSFLLEEYGVSLNRLLNGRRSVSPARRMYQGLKAIADALMARIQGNVSLEETEEEEAAAAAATAVVGDDVVVEFRTHH